MKRLLFCALLVTLVAAAAIAGIHTPITTEGQVKDISRDGDFMVIHLEQSHYTIRAVATCKVKTPNGARIFAADLLKGDNIRVEGDADGDQVSGDHVTLLLRIEHR